MEEPTKENQEQIVQYIEDELKGLSNYIDSKNKQMAEDEVGLIIESVVKVQVRYKVGKKTGIHDISSSLTADGSKLDTIFKMMENL